MTQTIADLAIWPEPDSRPSMSVAELGEILLDGTESTPVASIRGVYSKLEIHCLATGSYAVCPALDGFVLSGKHVGPVAIFDAYPGVPFSQVYTHALMWATRQMAEELEAEEG